MLLWHYRAVHPSEESLPASSWQIHVLFSHPVKVYNLSSQGSDVGTFEFIIIYEPKTRFHRWKVDVVKEYFYIYIYLTAELEKTICLFQLEKVFVYYDITSQKKN